MVREGEEMRDKIAKINYECCTGLPWESANEHERKGAYDHADEILDLFISNPFWKDIDRNIPSLDGIVVVNECKHHDSLGRNIINRTAKYPCCNGTGTITRQATIEEFIEWGINLLKTAEHSFGYETFKSISELPEGGRLRVKQ
jgi:hypothetical protein